MVSPRSTPAYRFWGGPRSLKWRKGPKDPRRRALDAVRVSFLAALAAATVARTLLALNRTRRLSGSLALASSAEEALLVPRASSGGAPSEGRDVSGEEDVSSPPASDADDSVVDATDDGRCSIYLAPSSVPDADDRPAGFGIYTTRPISEGEYVFPRGSGPVVPIPDYATNNRGVGPPWASSLLMPKCLGMSVESDQPHERNRPEYKAYPKHKYCYMYNNNLGSLTNYHPMLVNVMVDPTDEYRDDLLSRFKVDPGAGAFSYHMGEKWHATRHVEEGEELFSEYGETWFFDTILRAKDDIPHKIHYIQAARAIEQLVQFSPIDHKKLEKFHALVARNKHTGKLTRRLVDLATPNVDAYLQLIDSAEKYANASEEEHSRQWRLARSIGIRSTLNRDVDWIRKHGRCLDNVYPKRSTLPQAGQGGFAARRLERGQVIVPLPTMVLVTDRETLNVYKHKKVGGTMISIGAPYTKQLLVNYCFGHDDSPMLLCPATNANLINHCSARMAKRVGQCDPARGPNAVLRWATDFDPETSEWLAQNVSTVEERVKDGRRGLSLEIVALRNIGADEEIFLDYGPSWEEAWERHVSTWRPRSDDGSFVPVSEMNLDVERYLLTESEIEGGNATYPHENVRIGCLVKGFHHPCEILKRGEFGYSVRIREWHGQGESYGDFAYKWPFAVGKKITGYVSAAAIKFFAGPYASDQYLEGAFRHHIGVPEGVWPERWLISASTVNK